MNIQTDPKRRLSTARATLVLDHFFFGALALRLDLAEEIRGRTRSTATDGRSLFYDKRYVAERSDAELVGLMAHEVLHLALLHHTRRGDRKPLLWNECGDYAINPILTEAGFVLPPGVLNDTRYKGMTAEQIYDQRKQDSPPQNGGQGMDPGGGPPGGGQPNTGDDNGDGTGDPGERGGNGLADVPGAVFDSPDPAQQEAEWQIAVKQAAQAALMMGKLPAGIAEVVEEVLKPRIDWRAILRRFVQQFASADYSWRRPNRRYIASGLYLPEIRSEAMPPIVVFVDSSGSTRRVLPVFKAELQSIVEECQPEATFVIMVDAAVQRVNRFERGDPIEFNVEGFGGTDFCPGFDYVEREQLNPACAIYLTDGEGCFPDEPPEYPTLWAITTPDQQAPWGETITLDVTAS